MFFLIFVVSFWCFDRTLLDGQRVVCAFGVNDEFFTFTFVEIIDDVDEVFDVFSQHSDGSVAAVAKPAAEYIFFVVVVEDDFVSFATQFAACSRWSLVRNT